MLLGGLVKSRLFAVKFLKSQKLHMDFQQLSELEPWTLALFKGQLHIQLIQIQVGWVLVIF